MIFVLGDYAIVDNGEFLSPPLPYLYIHLVQPGQWGILIDE